MIWPGLFLIVLLCGLPGTSRPSTEPPFPGLSFTADSVSWDEHSAHGLSLDVAPGTTPRVQLKLERLKLAGTELAGLDGGCQLSQPPSTAAVDCQWRLEGYPLETGAHWQDGSWSAHLHVSESSLLALAQDPRAPVAAQWIRGGQLDMVWKPVGNGGAESSINARLSGLSFDSPDGLYAAEGLDLALNILTDGQSGYLCHGVLESGEVLLDAFYRDWADAPLSFEFRPSWNGDEWRLDQLSLDDGGALSIGLAVRGSAGLAEELQVDISSLVMNFPQAYHRYLSNIAALYTLDGLQVTGRLAWNGRWNAGRLESGDLDLDDLSVVDGERGRFAFTGLQARLRPGDYDFTSSLTWQGLLFGRINLGAGQAVLDSAPGLFALREPLQLDVLGGQVFLHEFRSAIPGSRDARSLEPDFRLRASLQDIDMEQVTTALDWPGFSGRLSGEIPAVKLANGVLDVEGVIRLRVFEGLVELSELSVERPFGVLPSLAASIDMEGLDLGQLTQTFEFGRISGRMDGHVHDLRLLDWSPVAFDAWMGTPAGQDGKRNISRQAVNHLTTIGGGRATAALTGPVMRLFNNFSYRRLGLGCRLENNICHVSGLTEDDQSVLIMEGAGIPKITIRAFNRRMDWPQLVSNLVAVSEDGGIRIGDQ